MRTFVYGSRVIENDQQIRLERKVKKVGNFVGTIVKFFVAFLFFVALNIILSNLAQHPNFSTVHVYRIIQEGARVLLIDNAFSTSSIIYQDILGIVAALTFISVAEYGFVVHLFGDTDESSLKQAHNGKREHKPQTVNYCGIVSYKQKVSFLS